MLFDAYQGGTVAAATPQRVGDMDAALLPGLRTSANSLPIVFGEAGPPFPLKREMKHQSHEK
jgi:hypothetical protein